MTNSRVKIVNRVEGNTLFSNLVYPPLIKWRWVCRVDKDWMKSQLSTKFGIDRYLAIIANKYAIQMGEEIYYQHDNNTYLIVPR